MRTIREEITNKIIETVKDKVYETFNNQANRLIDIRKKYLAWDKLHCDIHNDIGMDREVKKAKLTGKDIEKAVEIVRRKAYKKKKK